MLDRLQLNILWLFRQISFPVLSYSDQENPPTTITLPLFCFIGVNDVSGEGRQGRHVSSLKTHHLPWSAAILWGLVGSLKYAPSLFLPSRLSQPMRLETTGRANKHLYVRHRSDRWNKRLTGLKSSLAPQTWPLRLLVRTWERWEIN